GFQAARRARKIAGTRSRSAPRRATTRRCETDRRTRPAPDAPRPGAPLRRPPLYVHLAHEPRPPPARLARSTRAAEVEATALGGERTGSFGCSQRPFRFLSLRLPSAPFVSLLFLLRLHRQSRIIMQEPKAADQPWHHPPSATGNVHMHASPAPI